jgi:ATP-dependent helicase/nuclease subunit A
MEETDDVLRLMTIHNAKGLEFPIVVLANFNSDPSNEQTTFLERETGRLHVTTWVGSFKTPGFEGAWDREKEQDAAEDLRTLYVACTRARDHLIVPIVPHVTREPRGLSATLLDFLTSERGAFRYDTGLLNAAGASANSRVKKPGNSAIEPELRRRESWFRERDQTRLGASQGPHIIPASAAKDLAEGPSSEGRYESAPVWAARNEAATVGSALHRVMERIDLENPRDLEALTRAICLDLGAPSRAVEVVDMARNCLASPAVQRAIASRSFKREVPFTVSSVNGVAVGRLDLLFTENGEATIIDFKSDQIETNEIDERVRSYQGQADAYAEGVSASMGLVASRIVFVFAHLGVERPVVPSG